MSISALQEVPATFGAVSTDVREDLRAPERIGAVIYMPPLGPDTELYPLLGGTQFVLITQTNRFGRHDLHAYFGGTDEEPFLVEIRLLHAEILLRRGENTFYESLKPAIIQQLEGQYGRNRTIRQGDIYAYPLPLTKARLNRQVRGGTKTYPIAVYGTRHMLRDGYWIKATALNLPSGRTRFGFVAAIGEGTLTAPDHAPRQLEGPHIIARSRSMVESGPGVGD